MQSAKRKAEMRYGTRSYRAVTKFISIYIPKRIRNWNPRKEKKMLKRLWTSKSSKRTSAHMKAALSYFGEAVINEL